jgi:hypothetical protein
MDPCSVRIKQHVQQERHLELQYDEYVFHVIISVIIQLGGTGMSGYIHVD